MSCDTVLQYDWLARLREGVTLALLGNVIIIWVSFYQVSIFRVKADEASVLAFWEGKGLNSYNLG